MMRQAFRRWFLLVGFALLLCAGAVREVRAQRDLKHIPDPDPAKEQAALVVDPQFELNLFAAEPQVVKPIHMNFDPAGRLWVATSQVYPQLKPGQKPDDKIIVLEDTDGDGRADRSTVFARGLLIPTAVLPSGRGAFVANSSELLYLEDTDGDLRADRRQVVLAGFGVEDTHHIIHTFRFGPEGWMYFNQSIYIHSHVETPWGVRRLGGGGIWRYHPPTQRLEVFTRGLVNPWGHAYTPTGQWFATDGAGFEGINYLFPGAVFLSAPGARRVLHGLNPGSPKHCGLERLSGRHLPPEYVGDLVTNDFRGHRVCRFRLEEHGSGYLSRELPELIKTTHAAFRPVDVKMGPDGAIYIADWYNPIIQHGEVDFRDPRRDHKHGRIWRLVARGRKLLPRRDWTQAGVDELLQALGAPEDLTRYHARQVLRERPRQEVAAALEAWVARLPAGAEGDRLRLEALWLYQGWHQCPRSLLARVLESARPQVRAGAVRVLGQMLSVVKDPLPLLARAAEDSHPLVRLEAACALAGVNDPRGFDLLVRIHTRGLDQYLDFALWQAFRRTQDVWLPRLRQAELKRYPAAGLLFALKAVDSAEGVPVVLRLLSQARLAPEETSQALRLLVRHGSAPQLAQVYRTATGDQELPPSVRVALLKGLAQAARARRLVPQVDRRPLLDQLRRWAEAPAEHAAELVAALELLAAWKEGKGATTVVELVRSSSAPPQVQAQGLRTAAALQLPPWRKLAHEALSPKADPRVLQAALEVLLQRAPRDAATAAVELLGRWPEDRDPTVVFQVFLARQNGAALLTQALRGKRLPKEVAKVGLRLARTAARVPPELEAELRRAGGVGEKTPPPSKEEVARLARLVLDQGDPARGERVFRRADLACQRCHAISGAGGRVGPDLTSIGAASPLDYLIEAVLVPNKAIKENYHSLVVIDSQGKIHTGIRVREDQRELVLRDAEDRLVVIPKAQIEERAQGRSLMPEGLAEQMTRQELIDLLRFLYELGRLGPYQVNREPWIRTWEVLQPTRRVLYLIRRQSLQLAAQDHPEFSWKRIYSTVAGTLPREEVPVLRIQGSGRHLVVLRSEVTLDQPGRVVLEIPRTRGVQMWVDGQPRQVQKRLALALDRGRHRFCFAVPVETFAPAWGAKLLLQGGDSAP